MKRMILWAAIATLAGVTSTSEASAQVVADTACPTYAIDIAAFATCEFDRVANDETTPDPARRLEPEVTHLLTAGVDATGVHDGPPLQDQSRLEVTAPRDAALAADR